MAVSAAIQVIDAAYDVPAIDKIVDRIHVLTYDFHGEWEGFTHHHSPLYAHPLDSAGNATMNVVSFIQLKCDEVVQMSFPCKSQVTVFVLDWSN